MASAVRSGVDLQLAGAAELLEAAARRCRGRRSTCPGQHRHLLPEQNSLLLARFHAEESLPRDSLFKRRPGRPRVARRRAGIFDGQQAAPAVATTYGGLGLAENGISRSSFASFSSDRDNRLVKNPIIAQFLGGYIGFVKTLRWTSTIGARRAGRRSTPTARSG